MVIIICSSANGIEMSLDVENTQESLDSAPFSFENLISPPLPLSRDVPIALSQQNQRKYLNNPELIAQERASIRSQLDAKTFPLFTLFAALVIVAVILLARASPECTISVKEAAISPEEAQSLAVEKLKSLLVKNPVPIEPASSYFLSLENGLRTYLDTTYHLGAATSTSQELEKRGIPNIDEQLQGRLIDIIRQAERIKFSGHEVTCPDCETAIRTVNSLISSNTSSE